MTVAGTIWAFLALLINSRKDTSELTLFCLHKQLVFQDPLENSLDMLHMILLRLGKDKNIV